MRSSRSTSMSSSSFQPRISFTAVPQKRILQVGDKTKAIASGSSVIRSSAHRFLFVNSNVGTGFWAEGARDDSEGTVDIRSRKTLRSQGYESAQYWTCVRIIELYRQY